MSDMDKDRKTTLPDDVEVDGFEGSEGSYPPKQVQHDAVFGEMDDDKGPNYRSVRAISERC